MSSLPQTTRRMAGPSFCVQPRTGLHIGDMGGRVRRSRGFSSSVPPSFRFDLAAFFQRPQNAMSLVSIPANPVPEDAVSGTIKTPDGAEIRYARWAPPANRKGTVCIFQGRSEYIEKYFETVRDLRDRGFAWRRSTGAARGIRRVVCALRARAMCAISPTTRSTSKRSFSKSCCPIVRRRFTPSATRWAALFCCASRMRASAGLIGSCSLLR